jgi:AcrR family transcriptional regulator
MEAPTSDTRTALLHAAMACFSERGFDGTSMRMIADRARRPLSLLAHYFGNKEGLYLAVFNLIFDRLYIEFKNHPLPEAGCMPTDRQDAERILREQIQNLFHRVVQCASQSDPIFECGVRLLPQEVRSPRPELFPIMISYIKPTAETIKNCIKVLRPELGEDQVIFLGISIFGQVAGHSLMRGLNQVVWGRVELAENQAQAAEWLVDLCLNGLLARPGRGRKELA